MSEESLKNLPAKERLKKLKELEEKKKKEIEQARKLIKESEEELSERQKWKEKVPIPEFAKEDLKDVSDEAKEILKSRGVKEKKEDDEETDELDVGEEENAEDSLEGAVARERVPDVPATPQYGHHAPSVDYRPLEEQSIYDISQQMVEVYKTVDDQGYMTYDQQKQLEYSLSEIEHRLEDDTYSVTEDVAKAALLARQVGGTALERSRKYKSEVIGNNYHTGR